MLEDQEGLFDVTHKKTEI